MDRWRRLNRLEIAWRAFTDSYAGLSESRMVEPGVSEAWSIRDVIAHVTTWEEEAVKYLPPEDQLIRETRVRRRLRQDTYSTIPFTPKRSASGASSTVAELGEP